jgi:hypothetical protein
LLVAAVAVLTLSTTAFALGTFAPDLVPFKSPAERNAATEHSIRRVAARFGENLLTFDYRRLDADLAGLRRDTTANFTRHYQSALAGTLNDFAARVQRAQTVSTSDVKGLDITSRDDDTATVVVFGAQTFRSASQPQPRTTLLFLEVTLVKNHGGWKVDNVANATNPKN